MLDIDKIRRSAGIIGESDQIQEIIFGIYFGILFVERNT